MKPQITFHRGANQSPLKTIHLQTASPFFNSAGLRSDQQLPPNYIIDDIKRGIRELQKISIEIKKIVQNTNTKNGSNRYSTSPNKFREVFQKQMKAKFQRVVVDIRQFCKKTEQTLQYLSGIALTPQQSSYTKLNVEDSRFELLNEKINSLENSLRDKKQNQARMLHIIEKLVEKYQIHDNSMLSYHQKSIEGPQIIQQHKFTNKQSGYTQLQNQNYLSQLLPKKTRQDQSIYQGLYAEGQNRDVERQPNHFRLKQIEQAQKQTQFIKMLYSKNIQQKQRPLEKQLHISYARSNPDDFNNTKQSQSTSTQDDQSHRMQFMIQRLNRKE